MSERPETNGRAIGSRPAASTDKPGYVDGVPVEELVRLTREFTDRINNEDRQRLTAEASEAGRNIQSGAPFLLQQFLAGKIDLDHELSVRFPNAPLLSSAHFTPKPGERARRGFAQFKGQDESAVLNIDLLGLDGTLEAAFQLNGIISLRFSLGVVSENSRRRFLDLMRRRDGIAILWTRERWERDYFVFVVRNRFARMYAFAPGRFEAACRLTPNDLDGLLDWLTGFWLGEVSLELGSGEG